MGKTPVLVLMLVLGCKDGHLQAVTKCGQPCYTLATEPLSECRPGTWVCSGDADAAASCEGQLGPSEEICDGLDNNCDGLVDERLYQDCSNGCGHGQAVCRLGVFGSCSAPAPGPEICDGLDNNCDGRIDEPEALPLEFCYSGPPGTAQYGACRPGSLRCQAGKKVCVGEVLPVPETCNGADDNCDGQIDEGTNPGDPVDIVFIVDNSGSMGGTIAAVKAAAAGFSNTYAGRTDIRWGLAVAPDPDMYYDKLVRLVSNLDTPAVFAAAMMRMGATGGGSEPTLDALMFLCEPQNSLHVNWRAGSRHILVLFTDEEPQSYLIPEFTETQVNAAIVSSSSKTYVFTDYLGQMSWAPVLPLGWGQLRNLTNVASVMEAELTSIVEEASCH